MSISRRIWNARLFLLTVCVACTIFNAPTFIFGIAIGLLIANVIIYNPWNLARIQREEDSESQETS